MNKRFLAGILCAGIMLSLPVVSFADQKTTTATTKTESNVQRYEVLILGDKDQGTNSYVRDLQTWLKRYGYFNTEPTGYYGEITQKAVMDFQADHKMTVDGKAGPATRKILFGGEYKAIPSTRVVTNSFGSSIGEYSLGDRGAEIQKIQTRLKELGYYEYSRVTEYYGPITEEAVLKFKAKNGLSTANSTVDAQTYSLLFSNSATKYVKPVATVTTTATTTKKSTVKATTTKATTKATTTKKTTTKATTKKTTTTKKATTTKKVTVSSNSSKVEKMISAAMAQLGDKYVLGATGPNSFDCSGLLVYALKQVGVSGPRTSAAQSQYGSWQKVSYSQLQRGDLVFFASPNNSNVGHAGIYLGGGQFVHASSGKGKVIVSSLSSGYYKQNFRWGRRAI